MIRETAKEYTKEYFPHDFGTRHKKKMAAMRKEKKMRGYGLFWVIVEMLHEDDARWMDLDELTYISIAAQAEESPRYVQDFVDQCINRYKVFIQEGSRFTTARVLRNIDIRMGISESRAEAGRKGAEARWQNMANANGKNSDAMANDSKPIAKDGKEKENKEKKSKSYLRPKGLTASSEADPAELKQLKQEYDDLVTVLSDKENIDCWNGVKAFIAEKKPLFIEPYIDLWNIFALNRKLIKQPIRITDHRRKKFETRIKEPGFDFIAILAAVKKSAFLTGDNDRGWTVDFEFLIHSEENYTKIIEEKYK